MCQRHHPLPGSVTRGWEEKGKKQREEGDMHSVKEEDEEQGVCVCVSFY